MNLQLAPRKYILPHVHLNESNQDLRSKEFDLLKLVLGEMRHLNHRRLTLCGYRMPIRRSVRYHVDLLQIEACTSQQAKSLTRALLKLYHEKMTRRSFDDRTYGLLKGKYFVPIYGNSSCLFLYLLTL